MNSLSPTLRRLITSHGFFEFGRILFSIFFSIFIWSETESIRLVAIYNIILIISHTLAFTFFAAMVKRGRAHTPRALSLILSTIFFLILFFVKDQAIAYLVPIGFFAGFFSGMYWISYNLIKFDLTHTKNRGNYEGVSRSINTFIYLTAPALGGALITFNLFGIEYGNIFILAAICNLIAIVLGNVKTPTHKTPPLHLWKTFKVFVKNNDLIKITVAKLFGNIGYKGSMEKLLPIFIFAVLQNEFHVGGWLSIFSTMAIVTTYMIGKRVPYKYYKRTIILGGSLFFLATMSLVGFPMLITFIIYGFAREILLPMQIIPIKVYSENLIHQVPNYTHHRVEYIVIREWVYVLLSRLFSYGLLFFVTDLTGVGMQVVLGIMAICILIEPLIVKTIKNDLSKL
jgi:MFS transporter, YQGE family, putative transporter